MTIKIQEPPDRQAEYMRNCLMFALSRLELEKQTHRNSIKSIKARVAEIEATYNQLIEDHLIEMEKAGLYDEQVVKDVIKTSLAYIVGDSSTIIEPQRHALYDEAFTIVKTTYGEVYHLALIYDVNRLVNEAIEPYDKIPF